MGYEQLPPQAPPPSLGQVKAPAIALMVVAGLNILSLLVGMVFTIVGASMPTEIPSGAPPEAERMIRMLSGGVGAVLFFGIGIIASAFVLFGAMRMMNFRSWGLALAAAIMSITCLFPWPCFCCLPIGLPFGIWAIVVLANPNVKAAFR